MNTQLDSYELMLRESVKHFIATYASNGGYSGGFSAFESIFFRLIQTMPDPPIEITWFYSAVTSHDSKLTPLTNPVAKITLVKDLFQSLISCSNSSTGVKRIAVLAPVVYELYLIMCEVLENGLLRKEVNDLLEMIVSYVSICCDDRENVNESDIVVICIEDLVRVWTLDKVEKSCKFVDNVRVFFPVLSDEVRKEVSDRCRIEELAGMVLSEVFFLRLCMKLDSGALEEEIVNNTRHWAIETIKGFQNYYFLDGLLKMLLEPGLPVANLLSSQDTVFLQKALFDAVVLVDYSFMLSGSWIQSLEKLKNLALLWSLVADSAVQFARSISDEYRAVSYVIAFSESPFLNHLMVWITNQANIERPKIYKPRAVIKWLLGIEDQGLRVFEDDVLRVHAKAIVGSSKLDNELPEFKQHGIILQSNICTYTEDEQRTENEVNGDEEMMDSFDGVSPTAIFATNAKAVSVGRKRKEVREDVGGAKVKVSKYNCHESIIEEKTLPFSHGDAVDAGKGRRTQRWL